MNSEEIGPAGRTMWSVDRIPYHALDRSAVAENMPFFWTVTSASLVEFASAVYSDSLAELFPDDEQVTEWVVASWRPEELQHGEALKRYVNAAWPDFDWDEAYRGFITELAPLYTTDRLAPTRALEMLARCLVESGTATFYRTLSALAPEPVFQQLTSNIGSDEVSHYKHFYRHFLRYREIEKPRRTAQLRVLWARSSEIDAEDLVYAVKHISRVRDPLTPWHRKGYKAVRNASFRMMRDHYPFGMAVKMLLKPLGVGPQTTRLVTPITAAAVRYFLMR